METFYSLSRVGFLNMSVYNRFGELLIDAWTLGLAIMSDSVNEINLVPVSEYKILSSRRSGASCNPKTYVCISTEDYLLFQ